MSRPTTTDSPASRVRAARVAAGLTQAQLAAALGVTQGRVHAIEAGKPVTLETLWRIAGALGRPASELDARLAGRTPDRG